MQEQTRKKTKYPRKTIAEWIAIRDEYTRGVFEDGRHHYPSLHDLADKYGLSFHTIEHRSRRDSPPWLTQRQEIQALARAHADTAFADQIAESRRTFDNHALVAAHAALNKLVAIMRAFEPLDAASASRLRKGAAVEFRALAGSLADIQRVGRLALGYATENVAWRGEAKVELSEAAELLLNSLDVKSMSYEEIQTVRQVIGVALGGAGEAGSRSVN